MMTGAPLSLDESDFIVEHLLASSLDGKESRTYLVRDAVSSELACYFSLRTCLVPIALSDVYYGV